MSLDSARTAQVRMQPKGPGRRMRSMFRRGLRRETAGFTLIELLVVIAIISLLVSILIPSLNHAKFLAKNAVCLSNQHQIAIASITYAADFRDIVALASEATWINSIHGDRQTPRILADAKLLPITDKLGGVWRCPLDDRDYEPLFLCGYYYSQWGPGNPSDVPENYWMCSYSTNQLYRATSPRSTWSYWDPNKVFQAKLYSHAATPTNTIWFCDFGTGWDAHAPSPYQTYYIWYTLEYWDGSSPWMSHCRRHKPGNYGPFGNLAFVDGHVEGGVDYLETCTDDDYNSDEALALEWYSFTGE